MAVAGGSKPKRRASKPKAKKSGKAKVVTRTRLPRTLATTIAKSLIKPSKTQAPLDLASLNETVLSQRLEALEAELKDWKLKCDRLKEENGWYAEEIRSTKEDTEVYLQFLESERQGREKKTEELIEGSKGEFERFLDQKKKRQEENEQKIEGLKGKISELDDNIQQKTQEVEGLSDVMSRRAHHEATLAALRRQITQSEAQHIAAVHSLEKSLLQQRLALQKSTQLKLTKLTAEAASKANTYLASHIDNLDKENSVLSDRLRLLTERIQEKANRRTELQDKISRLERELQIRDDLLEIRLREVRKAELQRAAAVHKRKERLIRERRKILEGVLEKGSKAFGTILGKNGEIRVVNSENAAEGGKRFSRHW
ncbi:hypothetical protein BC832DRAFT_621536 [Gaertneriomyces semiglobifer]|nr:hypothetical protein BC832DRAFT_621536 [Gaertneriomyces semiglobifer]